MKIEESGNGDIKHSFDGYGELIGIVGMRYKMNAQVSLSIVTP